MTAEKDILYKKNESLRRYNLGNMDALMNHQLLESN